MGALNIRIDDAMERALVELAAARHTTPSEAVRYAVLRSYEQLLRQRADIEAEPQADNPDDREEMLAIQRFMGVL